MECLMERPTRECLAKGKTGPEIVWLVLLSGFKILPTGKAFVFFRMYTWNVRVEPFPMT